jgi:hypothetical protein
MKEICGSDAVPVELDASEFHCDENRIANQHANVSFIA